MDFNHATVSNMTFLGVGPLLRNQAPSPCAAYTGLGADAINPSSSILVSYPLSSTFTVATWTSCGGPSVGLSLMVESSWPLRVVTIALPVILGELRERYRVGIELRAQLVVLLYLVVVRARSELSKNFKIQVS